jgi:signal peptidase I
MARLRDLARSIAVLVVSLMAVLALAAVLAVRADQLRCLRVLTGSMTPTIRPGSLVIGTPTSGTSLHVGEIVMFRPPAPYGAPGGDPIVHRIAEVSDQDGTAVIRTKGDDNPVEDPWKLDGTRTTFFRLRAHSALAGTAVGTAHKWAFAGVAALVAVPLWLAGIRQLRPAAAPGRHRRREAALT